MSAKRSKTDIALDISDIIQGLDDEVNDESGCWLVIGSDPEHDTRTIGQIFYNDGTEAEVEITVKVKNIQHKEVSL